MNRTIIGENSASYHRGALIFTLVRARYLNYMSIGSIQQYPRVDISGIGIESRNHLRPEDIPGNWHISRIVNLGVATSDRIVLSVTPTEVKELPFRIIGVSACPACEDMGKS